MFKQYITSINYKKLIELQAKSCCTRLSVNNVCGQVKAPKVINTKVKTIRKG